MATVHPHDQYSEALSGVLEKYINNFDTGLNCVCGVGKVIDHATHSDPNALPRGIHDVLLGPTPPWRDLLDSFTVYHAYYCECCGLTYRRDVVEGVRGYRPLEVREPPPTSANVVNNLARSYVGPKAD